MFLSPLIPAGVAVGAVVAAAGEAVVVAADVVKMAKTATSSTPPKSETTFVMATTAWAVEEGLVVAAALDAEVVGNMTAMMAPAACEFPADLCHSCQPSVTHISKFAVCRALDLRCSTLLSFDLSAYAAMRA